MIRARGVKRKPTNKGKDAEESSRKSSKDSASWQVSLILLVSAICSFLFYGNLFRLTFQRWGQADTKKEESKDLIDPSFRIKYYLEKKKSKETGVDMFSSHSQMSKNLHDEFISRYGGEEIAQNLYKDGLAIFDDEDGEGKSVPRSVEHTAHRILESVQTSDPFYISFGGYSVTVGRGNYFHQSYPFVLQRILGPVFENLGATLQVRNAAIGGIPSFPYGWCMKEFLGYESNVISWDFSMNEGKNAQGLEAYLRHAVTSLQSPPMLILLDATTGSRRNLLKDYVSKGTVGPDALIIRKDFSYVPADVLKQNPLAEGFDHWNEFGSPKGAPGQGSWHYTYKKHELVGWLLSMYFLKALDRAVEILKENPESLEKKILPENLPLPSELPPPTSIKLGDPNAYSFMFGTPSMDLGKTWHMNSILCRTSFEPIVSGQLGDIVTSDTHDYDDITTPTDPKVYTQGKWVWDVGKIERDTKNKVINKYGGLGYIDFKIALYGIKESGKLGLFLPAHEKEEKREIAFGSHAQDYFQSLILCEVNEKRGDEECNLETDLSVVVGGVKAQSMKKINAAGTVYLKKPICLLVDIPRDAKISLDSVGETELPGIAVEIEVINENVTYEKGPCSISHVVWEVYPPLLPR